MVLTEKFAIVVALNGEFDLAGGREREQRRQKQDQQWNNSGRTGALQSVIDLEVDPPEADEAPPTAEQLAQAERELDDATRVEILAQRDETPAEVAARQGRGFGFWVSVLWALAFLCLGLAGGGGGMPFAAGAGALAALALWLTWRRPAPDAPQKVNCARGELNAIVLSNPSIPRPCPPSCSWATSCPSTCRTIGAPICTADDGRVDMDLRVQDYAVLRLGGNYSVDEEQRLFPRVFWGRHMTLALTGLAALGALWAVAPNLPGDLALTRAWCKATVRAAMPRPRRWRRIRRIRPACVEAARPLQLVQGTSEQAARADCDRLRWAARRRRCRSWKLIRPSWRCIPANS